MDHPPDNSRGATDSAADVGVGARPDPCVQLGELRVGIVVLVITLPSVVTGTLRQLYVSSREYRSVGET